MNAKTENNSDSKNLWWRKMCDQKTNPSELAKSLNELFSGIRRVECKSDKLPLIWNPETFEITDQNGKLVGFAGNEFMDACMKETK